MHFCRRVFRMAGIWALVGSVLGCKMLLPPFRGAAETESFAEKNESHYSVLLPMTSLTQSDETCFYHLSWKRVGSGEANKQVEKVTRSPLSKADFTDMPYALASFSATLGLSSSIVATALCLSSTAGTGSPLCFSIPGGVAAIVSGAAIAAAANNKKWETAFAKTSIQWTTDSNFKRLISQLHVAGTRSKPTCPNWSNFATKARESAWTTVLKLTASEPR